MDECLGASEICLRRWLVLQSLDLFGLVDLALRSVVRDFADNLRSVVRLERLVQGFDYTFQMTGDGMLFDARACQIEVTRGSPQCVDVLLLGLWLAASREFLF